jgi:hypothetical protein
MTRFEEREQAAERDDLLVLGTELYLLGDVCTIPFTAGASRAT